MKPLRFDLVFSYWIYIWYLLYALKYVNYSPKFPLIIGLIDNIIMLILMLSYGTSSNTIMYFIIINTFIKLLPLYYLRKETIRWRDIYFTFILFILFIIWLNINEQSLVGNLKLMHDSLISGNNKTPFLSLLDKIKNNFKELKII